MQKVFKIKLKIKSSKFGDNEEMKGEYYTILEF